MGNNSNIKNDPKSVKLEDIGSSLLNPATEETLQALPTSFNDEYLWLLRRLVKIMESSGTVDIQNRQRINVDNQVTVLPSSYYTGIGQFNIPNSSVFAPQNNSNVTYVQPVQTGPVDPRWQII
ncbi:hypothetical protein HGB13_00205, partial [bacterium]|nr:hypothetical protein [bacterium]